MTAFFRLLKTHLRGFFRDRSAWFWSFAFPILFIVMFGSIFGARQQSAPSFKIGVVNEDHLPGGAAFVQGLQKVPIFELKAGSRQAELAALKKGDRRAVVIIPPDFSRSFSGGGGAVLDVRYDETQQQIWPAIRSALEQAVVYINQRQMRARPLVQLKMEKIHRQSRDKRPIDFLLPGIVAMSIMQLGLFSALPIVRERELGILKRIGATPLPRRTYVLSQLVFRVIVGLLQTSVLIGVGMILFRVRFEGNLLLFCLFIVLGALTFMMMGGVIGGLARSTEGAMPMVQMVNFPFMFLGGVFFPIDLMPRSLQPVVRIIPTSYLSDAIRSITFGQANGVDLVKDALVLLAWMIGGLLVASKVFRWE